METKAWFTARSQLPNLSSQAWDRQTRGPFITAKRAYHGNARRESELGDVVCLHQHGRRGKDAAQGDSR